MEEIQGFGDFFHNPFHSPQTGPTDRDIYSYHGPWYSYRPLLGSSASQVSDGARDGAPVDSNIYMIRVHRISFHLSTRHTTRSTDRHNPQPAACDETRDTRTLAHARRVVRTKRTQHIHGTTRMGLSRLLTPLYYNDSRYENVLRNTTKALQGATPNGRPDPWSRLDRIPLPPPPIARLLTSLAHRVSPLNTSLHPIHLVILFALPTASLARHSLHPASTSSDA
jgi:hypothetical protein